MNEDRPWWFGLIYGVFSIVVVGIIIYFTATSPHDFIWHSQNIETGRTGEPLFSPYSVLAVILVAGLFVIWMKYQSVENGDNHD